MKFYEDDFGTIYQGDSLEVLKNIPDETVDSVVTSPPYWQQRRYLTTTWIGGDDNCSHVLNDIQKNICSICGAKRVDDQLGLEETPEEFVQKLADVFDEIKRVLKKDGTCFVNLGNSYYGGGWKGSKTDLSNSKQGTNGGTLDGKNMSPDPKHNTYKDKDLVPIAWLFGIELQKRGWWLRQDIIWSKKSPMPESVTDRFTKSKEYILFLTKSKNYYFDNEATKEPSIDPESYSGKRKRNEAAINLNDGFPTGDRDHFHQLTGKCYPMKNKRDVWHVSNNPEAWEYCCGCDSYYDGTYKTTIRKIKAIDKDGKEIIKNECPQCHSTDKWTEHFAMYSENVILPCVLSTPTYLCEKCGSPHERIIEKGEKIATRPGLNVKEGTDDYYGKTKKYKYITPIEDKGWKPTCDCNVGTKKPIILDPFFGSGTTGVVAVKYGRNYIGIDLSVDYCKVSKARLSKKTEQEELF